MRISLKTSIIVVGIALIFWLLTQFLWLPDGSEFALNRPKSTALMLESPKLTSDQGRAIKYSFVPIERISPNLRLAILIAEDVDFPSHSGFASSEIWYSLMQAISRFQKPRGASTISQQLAKNLYLSRARSPIRKIKEAIITFKLERSLSKRRIFELYLNIIELGPGVYGAEAGSQYWFSKSALELSVSEATKLAAILPGPNGAFNPIEYPQKVLKKQEILLRRMKRMRLPKGL